MIKGPLPLRGFDFDAGLVLPVDKPLGWTSADVVRKVKWLLRGLGFKKIKVGHAGTLDPLATGVLVVCVGRATKMAEALQAEDKEYEAAITLGATTPSYDLEHPVDAVYPTDHITREAVDRALAGLCGRRMQMPPVYSAKKIEGMRAYEYAREGAPVELRAAPIEIRSIGVVDFQMPVLTVRVACSKGTYIRSLAHEVGVALDSGAHLSALCRTRSGGFTVGNCYSMEEIDAGWREPREL